MSETTGRLFRVNALKFIPMRLALLAVLSLLCTCVRAQSNLSPDAVNYLYEVSRKVDPDRYSEVRGTPYRYKEFGPVVIYDITLNKYELDSANLNGFTSQFEFYVDGILRELLPGNFIRAEVPDRDGMTHKYAHGINAKFPDRYAEIVYKGDNIIATMVYEVKNDEKVVQDVGKTLRLRRFNAKSLHLAMVDGDLVPITLSAKKLAADLGFKKEIAAYIKEEKLKPGQRADLLKIYARADEMVE